MSTLTVAPVVHVTAADLMRGRPAVHPSVHSSSLFKPGSQHWKLRYRSDRHEVEQIWWDGKSPMTTTDGEFEVAVPLELSAAGWAEALNRFATRLADLGAFYKRRRMNRAANIQPAMPRNHSEFLPDGFEVLRGTWLGRIEFFQQLAEAYEVVGLSVDATREQAAELQAAVKARAAVST
ncbi:hypothetical protein [Microbacterium sp. A84]|uniref:hypothetical protein n=1 Tax=Microbacterium sp. A84 TaxID=3450715 RepID=UPI003F429D79